LKLIRISTAGGKQSRGLGSKDFGENELDLIEAGFWPAVEPGVPPGGKGINCRANIGNADAFDSLNWRQDACLYELNVSLQKANSRRINSAAGASG